MIFISKQQQSQSMMVILLLGIISLMSACQTVHKSEQSDTPEVQPEVIEVPSKVFQEIPSAFEELEMSSEIEEVDEVEEISALIYTQGEILLIEYEQFMYIAKVTENCKESDLNVSVHIFHDGLREKLGDKIPMSRIVQKREEPRNGWGNRKTLIEYFDGEQWFFAKDVKIFRDYYLLPNEKRVDFGSVRIPVPIMR